MENEAQLINKYQAEFENACDDLYYGYGYNFWRTHNNSIEDDSIAKMVWKAAFDKMSANESKTKNMKKDIVKINEEQLRKIVGESVKKVLKEWINPGDGKYYIDRICYDPSTNSFVGDMTYDICDIEDNVSSTPESARNELIEYLKYDLPNWEDEYKPDMPLLLFVTKDGKNAIDNTYYMSSLDKQYFKKIQSALGLGVKVVVINAEQKNNNLKENRKSKRPVKINESQLKNIVAESVKNMLNFASSEPQYDINSDEYEREWHKGLDFDDIDGETEREIKDYEALPDKARHPYGSEFPDFSERIANRQMYKYGDKLAQKEPNSVLSAQSHKRTTEQMADRAKKSLGFAIWCFKNKIEREQLSNSEMSELFSVYLEELREKEEWYGNYD